MDGTLLPPTVAGGSFVHAQNVLRRHEGGNSASREVKPRTRIQGILRSSSGEKM